MEPHGPLEVRKLADAILTGMAGSTPTAPAMLRGLAAAAAESGPFDRIALLVGEGERVRAFGPVAADGSGPDQEEGVVLSNGEDGVGPDLLPAQPKNLDASTLPPLAEALRSMSISHGMLVPLLDGHGVVGTLVLARPDGEQVRPEALQESMPALTTLGAHLGTALSLRRMAAGVSGRNGRSRPSEGKAAPWDAEAIRSMTTTGRLASLGTLAGGVIHEVNNPAAFIALAGGQIEKVVTQAQEENGCEGLEPVVELAKGIRESMDQIRDLIAAFRLLVDVAKQSVVVTVDLERVLKASVELTRAAHRHDAILETDFQPMPPCPGHYVEIGPVIVQVLVNAIESLHATRSAKRVRVSGRVRHNVIQVMVQDTGEGIAPTLLPRVFDPFFTTRDRTRHAGLGLTIARQALTMIGGRMDIESELGKGTTVRIDVPVRQTGEEPDEARTAE